MNATQATAAMVDAVEKYRQESAVFTARTDGWDRRYANQKDVAESRKRTDNVRADAAAAAAWYRDEAVMYAAVAQVLLQRDEGWVTDLHGADMHPQPGQQGTPLATCVDGWQVGAR